jgi:hypothetical protein
VRISQVTFAASKSSKDSRRLRAVILHVASAPRITGLSRTNIRDTTEKNTLTLHLEYGSIGSLRTFGLKGFVMGSRTGAQAIHSEEVGEMNMEERVGKLEVKVDHIQSDITDMKTDIRELRHDVQELKEQVGTQGKDLSAETGTQGKELRAEMSAQGEALRAQISAQGNELRAEMAEQGRELRAEMAEQGRELRAEIAAQGKELRAEIAAQGKELRAEIAAQGKELRAEMNALGAALRAEIKELATDLATFKLHFEKFRGQLWVALAVLMVLQMLTLGGVPSLIARMFKLP